MVGGKCDKCQPSFFDFPSCQKGLSKLMIHVFFGKSKLCSLLFQSANVILMVQNIWSVEESMVIAFAKRDLLE